MNIAGSFSVRFILLSDKQPIKQCVRRRAYHACVFFFLYPLTIEFPITIMESVQCNGSPSMGSAPVSGVGWTEAFRVWPIKCPTCPCIGLLVHALPFLGAFGAFVRSTQTIGSLRERRRWPSYRNAIGVVDGLRGRRVTRRLVGILCCDVVRRGPLVASLLCNFCFCYCRI